MGVANVIHGFFYFLIIISIFSVGPFLKCPLFSEANCVWYGECGSYNQNPQKILNCPYNGVAKPASEKVKSILMKWCPHYFDKEKEDILMTCCDENQLNRFETQVVNLAMLVKRCPSCQYNFIEHVCEFTCRSDQSSFIEVVKTATTSSGSTGVSEINLYMSKNYTYRTYDSCKGLILPLANQHVMDILCNRPALSCSPELWFEFIGDANAFSPFQINYKLTDKSVNGFKPLNIRAFACNEKPLENLTACNCIDCLESCPSSHITREKCRLCIGSLFLSCFVAIWIFIIGEGIIIFLFVYYWRKEKKALLSGEAKPDFLSQICKKIRHTCGKIEEISAKMEKSIENSFSILGKGTASQPWIFTAGIFITFILFSIGMNFVRITTDPIELWANPTSQSRLDKNYFDTHFNPFYRTEQIIIKAVNLPDLFYNDSKKIIRFGPVFHDFFLLKVFELQKSILKISVGGKTLKDHCMSFLTESGSAETSSDCAVQSIWGYFQDNPERVQENSQDYLNHILICMNNPHLPDDCLAPWGGPILPGLAFGGFLKAGLDKNKKPRYEKANVLILTYLLKNDLHKQRIKPAKEWETEFIKLLKSWSKNRGPDYMDISFKAEMSVEDELTKDSQSDVVTILISYIIMFIYIVIFLGKYTSLKRIFVDSRISLGFLGLILVLMSVSSSIGFFGYVGVPATPIIVEVIPFLVLAIGVDNIFIIVLTYDRLDEKPNETIKERVGRMMGIVGPSVTLCSLSECCCFFVGGLSEMPAVRAFALYAGTALLLDFIFQITCFVSILALDSKRLIANRFDLLCCLKSHTVGFQKNDTLLLCFKKFYVPYLMNKYARPIIIVVFFGLFCLSMASFSFIEIGFPQEYSMSKHSYLYKYFKDLKEYLSIGPPVYFVIKDSPLNYSLPVVQNMFCSGSYCDPDSFTSRIYQASRASEVTYIATPATSWIDDFFDWSSYDVCCKMNSNKTFCPHSDYDCEECLKEELKLGRPTSRDFERYISFFLRDNPDSSCGKAGHPSYGSGVKLKFLGVDSEGFKRHAVGANYFMAYHNILKSSKDYYQALDSAIKLSSEIKNSINSKISKLGYDFTVNVFPYSVFYVYYEQYLTIWKNAVQGILLSFTAIFVVSFILLGLDFWSSCLIVSTIAMIITDIVGVMYLWNVQLNAISLVNVVLGVGISVEFCSHFTHYFIRTKGPNRIHRASASLSEMGSSIFAGITITKFIGISVLAFAKSQIFQVFYFRMFFTIVLTAAAHGLIYLPVLLSYVGSDTHLFFLKKSEEENTRQEENINAEANNSTTEN